MGNDYFFNLQRSHCNLLEGESSIMNCVQVKHNFQVKNSEEAFSIGSSPFSTLLLKNILALSPFSGLLPAKNKVHN